MIRIDWFSDEVIQKYYNDISKNLPDQIKWYDDGKGQESVIDKYKLITASRKDLLSDPDLQLYVELSYLFKIKPTDYKKKVLNLFNDRKFKSFSDDFLNNNKAQIYYSNNVLNVDNLLRIYIENCKKCMDDIYKYELNKNKLRKNQISSLYDIISDKKRAELMISLNVNSCPYCNRLFITKLRKNNNNMCSTADLDHFYNKDIFPLFALSFFNFVPSCQVCNSRLKSTRWEECVYPYDEGFDDDGVFEVDYNKLSTDDIYNIISGSVSNVSNIPIKLEVKCNLSNPEKSQRINNSKNIFYLEELYKCHEEYAAEVILKKRIYTEDYIKSLENALNINSISPNDSLINMFLYGYYMDETNKYDKDKPLSKLTYDLIFR